MELNLEECTHILSIQEQHAAALKKRSQAYCMLQLFEQVWMGGMCHE